ncbi:MAG: hypothetical protein RBS34_13885 [Desulfofustis sp.]|jgi:hypothetical protein|nr:hypothetical protein [Desulfofustis sp.]
MAGPLAISFTTSGFSAHEDRPHRLAGHTLLNGAAVRRRVEVRKRRTGEYVISTVTQSDGAFEFVRLPPQTLAEPYIVTCYDDATAAPANALVFDHVYQVDDEGNIPTS